MQAKNCLIIVLCKKLRLAWLKTKLLFVRIKYRIFGNRFGTSEIPDNILEAIARTMLPDIREFFLSKEGQAEFAAWKAEQDKKDKK